MLYVQIGSCTQVNQLIRWPPATVCCASKNMFFNKQSAAAVPFIPFFPPLNFVVQVLHEELMYANFVNPFRPGDAMTSLTYVHRVEQHPNGERVVPFVHTRKLEAGRFRGYTINCWFPSCTMSRLPIYLPALCTPSVGCAG